MSRRTRNAFSFGYHPLPQRLIVILCVPQLSRFIDYIFALLISCLGFRSHPHRFGRAKCADRWNRTQLFPLCLTLSQSLRNSPRWMECARCPIHFRASEHFLKSRFFFFVGWFSLCRFCFSNNSPLLGFGKNRIRSYISCPVDMSNWNYENLALVILPIAISQCSSLPECLSQCFHSS